MNQDEIYQAILEDISARSGGDFSKMSISDRMVTKEILMNIKADLVEWLDENLHVIEFFENYDPAEDIIKSKEPDLDKLRGLDIGYRYDIDKCMELHRQSVRNNINKMGGI